MKKFFIYSLGAMILVIVILAGIIYTIDVNQYKDDIIAVVEKNTGRDFVIEGDLEVALSLIPTLEVERVRLGNAPWGSTPDMVSIGRFEAQLALLPLLRGNIQVNRLLLTDSEILLETNTEGQGNWIMESLQDEQVTTSAPESGSTTLPSVNISEIFIANVQLTYRDGITEATTRVVIDEISSHTGSFSEPTDLTLRAAYNDIPISMSGVIGSLETLAANEEYPVELQITAGAASLGLKGTIAQPLAADGAVLEVSFAVASLADLNELAGAQLPQLGPVQFSGTVVQADGTIQVKTIIARAGSTDLSGEVSLQTGGERPRLIADLKSELLDLTPLAGTEAEAEREKTAKVFSSAELPLESLKSVDAELHYRTTQLNNGEMELTNVALTVRLDNGRLRIDPFQSRLAGGDIYATLDLDTGAETAALTTELSIADLELGQLPQIKKDQSLSGGRTDVNISARGTGNSVAGIMAGLDGKILVQVGNGTIANSKVDLVGADLIMETFSMLNPLAKQEDSSELECAVVNINIKQGMAVVDKGIALQTSKMNIVGDGTINLRDETLDLSIRPRAREGIGIGIGSLASLVKLGGTLADPKPVADAGAVLEAGKSAGAAITNISRSLLGGESESQEQSTAQNPCAVALGIAPSPAVQAARDTSRAEPAAEESSVGGAVGDTVKGAADKAKGLIKGLFGSD